MRSRCPSWGGTRISIRRSILSCVSKPVSFRRRLERYYLTGGAGSGIRIDLPKGSYVPSFIRTAQQPALPVAANLDHLTVRRSAAMPVALSGGVLASAGLA